MSTNDIKRVFYDTRETAAILGIAKVTLYRLLRTGRLPHIRIQNRIRINIADIKALSWEYNADGKGGAFVVDKLKAARDDN